MGNKHRSFAVLALIMLVASILACYPPTPTAIVPQAPPPTVTPYVPPPSPPEETAPPPPPTESPTEAVTPSTSPETTEPVEPTETTEPTDTPTPTPTPTIKPTAKPTTQPGSTPTPTKGVSEGPLDFEVPRWVHSWEKREDGVHVVLRVVIVGGAPPFTVSHGPNVHGQSMGREYLLDFDWGCGNMAQSITVESSDGQRVKKDYWIGMDQQPWCGG